MHAIKGSWVGQTFALATSNDYGGKKSRFRRSKEEWKERVVSFIKKYQSGNDGNFPSLSLTRKEVGGSFYTVREIVREAIQENRVLGPAKFLHSEENNDHSSNHNARGEISAEPESSLAEALNGSLFVSDQNQSSGGEYYLVSNGVIAEAEHQPIDNEEITKGNIAPAAENGQFDVPEVNSIQILEMAETEEGSVEVAASDLINQTVESEAEASLVQPVTVQSDLSNGSYSRDMSSKLEENVAVELGKERSVELCSSEKLMVDAKDVHTPMGQLMDENSGVVAEKTVEKPLHDLEMQKSAEDVSAFKPNRLEMTDVVVETFPLRPLVKSTDHINESSGEVGELSVNEKASKVPCIEVENGSLLPKGTPMSGVGNPERSLPETNAFVEDKKVEDLTDLSSRSSISPSNQKTVNSNSQLQTSAEPSCNGKAGEVAEVVGAPSSIPVKPMNRSLLSAGARHSTTEEFRPKDDIRHSDSSEEEDKSTLDRINIETWEGTSAKQKVHPLLAVFKSFVDSFIKFWSE